MTKEEFVKKIILAKELAEQLHGEAVSILRFGTRNIDSDRHTERMLTLRDKAEKTLYTARNIFDELDYLIELLEKK